MGWGGFGSNGSVHWKIVHTGEEKGQGFVKGRDPNIAYAQPGYSKPAAGAPAPEYVVTLRFAGNPKKPGEGKERARRALNEALKSVEEDKNGVGIARVRVPAIGRPKPPLDAEFEIVIRWEGE